MRDTDLVLGEENFIVKHWTMSAREANSDAFNLLSSCHEEVLGLNWDPVENNFKHKVKLNFSRKIRMLKIYSIHN